MKRAILSVFIGVSIFALGIASLAYRHHRRQSTIPQMLLELNGHLDPRTYPFMSAARAELARARLRNPALSKDPNRLVRLELSLANELTDAGKTDEALQEFHLIEDQRKANPRADWGAIGPRLLLRKAIAYL